MSTLRTSGRLVVALSLVGVWVALSVLAAGYLFLSSSRTTVIAGHDAVVRPTLDGYAEVSPGALLPDVRMAAPSRLGVDVQLGKTEAASTDELVQRYAFIASQPDAQIEKVVDLVQEMAVSAALRGVVLGAVPVAVWLLLGSGRRRQLLRAVPTRRGVAVVVVLAVAATLVWQPWSSDEATIDASQREGDNWEDLDDFLGGAVPLPDDVEGLQVRADVTTAQSRRLIESAISTFESSQEFYAGAAEEAADLELREPEDDETVVLFVTDRHDNIGMDPVARAIGEAGGAETVFNGGDDTSTGKEWEAFSLDSVQSAFSDWDRYMVTGNHDQGDFVGDYLGALGWTRVNGAEAMDGPGDSVIMGVDDPRSSGLGNWRDEPGLSFGEVRDRLTEAACEAEERVNTLLVHDANLGRDALAQGCVDLVIGGHVHVRSGPTPVRGDNDEVGYTYTGGTTGGAAYAIAVGSKPRRPAEVTLITYREGRPVGLQYVVLQTNGRFDVGDYTELAYDIEFDEDGNPLPTEAPEVPDGPEDTGEPDDDGLPTDDPLDTDAPDTDAPDDGDEAATGR